MNYIFLLGDYSMLIEVLFGTTQELDQFINHLQQFGRTGRRSSFDARGAPRRARSRAGGEAIKTKSLPHRGKVPERSEVG